MQGKAAVLMSTIDHLVVAAASLAEGAFWCEKMLGVSPEPGGAHPLMGTHNRLTNVSSPAFPHAYLEIIAIEPGITPTLTNGKKRWFDLDDAVLQARIAKDGPQLIHFVASVTDVRAGLKALSARGLDRGEAVQASRQSAGGLLSWRITMRDDGQRLFYGCLPTLIEWGSNTQGAQWAGAPAHPVDGMPASGVTLESLQVSHPRPGDLENAYASTGLTGIGLAQGTPNLRALLMTPLGRVTLESKGA